LKYINFREDVTINDKPFILAIDYNTDIHISIDTFTNTITGKALVLTTVAPEMAKSMIEALELLLEWHESDLYKWAKKKTWSYKHGRL